MELVECWDWLGAHIGDTVSSLELSDDKFLLEAATAEQVPLFVLVGNTRPGMRIYSRAED